MRYLFSALLVALAAMACGTGTPATAMSAVTPAIQLEALAAPSLEKAYYRNQGYYGNRDYDGYRGYSSRSYRNRDYGYSSNYRDRDCDRDRDYGYRSYRDRDYGYRDNRYRDRDW